MAKALTALEIIEKAGLMLRLHSQHKTSTEIQKELKISGATYYFIKKYLLGIGIIIPRWPRTDFAILQDRDTEKLLLEKAKQLGFEIEEK